MSAPALKLAEPVGAVDPLKISCRNTAALALTVVRDGVITGEGPTTKGRIHFSRALDAERKVDLVARRRSRRAA